MHSVDGLAKRFWFFIGLAFLIGTVLRLYMLSDQILLGDEWHGIDYAIGNSSFYLLTHFALGATSIPMNLYRSFLLKTFGWSEFLLRLPALIPAILSLAVLPVFVRKIFSRRATIIFAFLLAISPFLIFYSRVCRPYAMYMLLGFLSVWALYLWVVGGERKYACIYVAAGVLATYFHLIALVPILTALGFVFLVKLIRRLTTSFIRRVRIVPGFAQLTLAAFSVLFLLTLLLLPALMQSLTALVRDVDRMALKSLIGFACLLAGTSNKMLVGLFWVLLVVGQVMLFRKSFLLAGMFISIFVSYFLAMIILSPAGMDCPIVILRYAILLYPASYILVALAMDSFLKYFQSAKLIKGSGYGALLSSFMTAGFLAVLFFAGPLVRLYASPNNFTNHCAFQESYEPPNWDQSYITDMGPEFLLNRKDIPRFYQRLSSELNVTAVIEYPMVVGDFNLYYYQHFHGKKVIAGYFTKLDIMVAEKSPGFVCSNTYVDQILSRMADTSKLKFRNMISVADIEALRHSQAEYIILHKNLMTEFSPHLHGSHNQIYKTIPHLYQIYRSYFASPVFEDNNLIVFRIPPPVTLP